MPSAPSSERSELADQLRLMKDNIDLLFKKIEELGDNLQTVTSNLDETRQQLTTTMELEQQVVSSMDGQVDKLGDAVASLYEVMEMTQEQTGSPRRDE